MAVFESKCHSLVIDCPYGLEKEFNKEFIYSFFQDNYMGADFIGIIHDKDEVHTSQDKEGEHIYKKVHCHIYLEVKHKIKTTAIFSDFIDYVFDKTGIEISKDCLSDKRVFDKNMCVRYLLHLDDSEKYQYQLEDLFYSDDRMLKFLDEVIQFDVNELVNLISNSKSYIEFLGFVGIDYATRHYRVIEKLWGLLRGENV